MSFRGSERRWAVGVVLLLVLAFPGLQGPAPAILAGQGRAPATAVFLVRHAEKDTQKVDPSLTTQGRDRAVLLARLLRNRKIAAVYATQYLRTEQTVRPLCDSLGIRSMVMNANRDSLPHDARLLASAILRDHRGDTVLVCGHSNTIPSIIKAFGVEETVSIADQEYNALFLVTIPDSGRPTLTRQRFGR